MMARSMVSLMMSPNWSKPRRSTSDSVNIMPMPSMNERRRAVSMSHIGLICKAKYGFTAATARSIFPAPRPSFPMAGVTSPSTRRGTMNLRQEAKKTLKVLRMRSSTSGITKPRAAPRAMAITTRGNRPSRFMVLELI